MNEQPSKLLTALTGSFLALILSLGLMQPHLTVSGLAVQYTDIIFLVTFALWVAAIILKKIEFRFDNFFVLPAVYFAGLFLSAVFSFDPGFSFVKLLGEGYLIGLAVVTYSVVRSATMFKTTVHAWLAASTVSCLVGFATVVLYYLGISNLLTEYALHHYGSLTPGNYPRIQGTFIYPAMLCNYLTVSITLLLTAFELGWVKRYAAFILLFLFLITAAFTVTPGIGGVLLAVFLCLWVIFKEKKKKIPARASLIFGVLCAAAFLVVSTFSLTRIETSPYFFTIFGQRIDPKQRLLTWQQSIETFLTYPFFGKGLGLDVASVSFRSPSGVLQRLTDAHQTWLNVAGEAGISGLIPLILICIAVVYRSLPLRTDGSKKSAVRVFLGVAFITAFLYQGLTGSFENARHLWVLVGLIVAVTHVDFNTEVSEKISNS